MIPNKLPRLLRPVLSPVTGSPQAPPEAGRRRRSWLRRAGAVLVAGLLETGTAGGQPAEVSEPPSPAPAAGVEGTFDVATVEDLALFYATESVRRVRVPLVLRLASAGKDGTSREEEIEKIRRDPPRLDDRGVVFPFGDKNPLSFALDLDRRTLSCRSRLVSKRGTVGHLGLTGPELAAALNASSSRERDRGGADFAYDPILDALSLQRVYRHPPADRDRFYEEMDGLIATRMSWAEGRYLERAEAIAEDRRPPASATAASEGFTASLVLRHFSAPPGGDQPWAERYLRAWDRPHGAPAPRLVSDGELVVDQTVHAHVHFRGAAGGERDATDVVATFRLIGPLGDEVFSDLAVPIWRGPVPPPDHLQIGVNDISFALDRDNPPGDYRLEATVCDAATGLCVELVHPFLLRPGEGMANPVS